MNRTSLWLFLLPLFAAATGCSGGNCTVSGRVTLDGQPLSNGRIALRPAAQMASARSVSVKINDGKFSFTQAHGIVPGSYTVMIRAWRKTGRKLKVDEAEELDEHEQYLPAEYNAQSQIATNIRGNTGGLRFELRMPESENSEEKESPPKELPPASILN
jgi:hypothetical protein